MTASPNNDYIILSNMKQCVMLKKY